MIRSNVFAHSPWVRSAPSVVGSLQAGTAQDDGSGVERGTRIPKSPGMEEAMSEEGQEENRQEDRQEDLLGDFLYAFGVHGHMP